MSVERIKQLLIDHLLANAAKLVGYVYVNGSIFTSNVFAERWLDPHHCYFWCGGEIIIYSEWASHHGASHYALDGLEPGWITGAYLILLQNVLE